MRSGLDGTVKLTVELIRSFRGRKLFQITGPLPGGWLLLFADLSEALTLVSRLLQKPFTMASIGAVGGIHPPSPPLMLLPRFVLFEVSSGDVNKSLQLTPLSPERLPSHLHPERLLNLRIPAATSRPPIDSSTLRHPPGNAAAINCFF